MFELKQYSDQALFAEEKSRIFASGTIICQIILI